MSSINSAMSQMSVSYQGNEVPFEQAIDECFRDLQTHLNNTHCSVRSMGMLADQDDDFKTAVEYSDSICDNIEDMTALFKELKNMTIQVRGKPSGEDKEWLKQHEAKRKSDKLREKKESKKMSDIKE